MVNIWVFLCFKTPVFQWKYFVKGVTSQYNAPRGQSGLQSIGSHNNDSKLKRLYGKKKNYVVENMYILQTAVPSTIKGVGFGMDKEFAKEMDKEMVNGMVKGIVERIVEEMNKRIAQEMDKGFAKEME